VPSTRERAREPKASRARVWQACDRILRSGRRPTVEGVRELLAGGSPNAVTSYINDWYADLGSRLLATETPLAGIPAEAISLMTELWRVAARSSAGSDADAPDVASRMLEAERDAFAAESKALQTLNKELQRHRATTEQSLAEARALLSRREAALDAERARCSELEQALVQLRLELEVAAERQRLHRPPRSVPSRSKAGKSPARSKPRPATPGKRKHLPKPGSRNPRTPPIPLKRKQSRRRIRRRR
jgi:hypothetical protein